MFDTQSNLSEGRKKLIHLEDMVFLKLHSPKTLIFKANKRSHGEILKHASEKEIMLGGTKI